MSTVDVVIPCYKYAHYLEGCVASVLNQRNVDVRILILDDDSPDNTPEIGRALAASDSRVSYVRNEKNLGLIGTANLGIIDWATSDYTLLLSADDLLTPGSLARAARVMDAHGDVNLVYGLSLFMDESGKSSQPVENRINDEYALIRGADFIRYNFTHSNPVPSPTAVTRTAVQKELGGYLPCFHHTSDMEMWMRFAARGPIGAIRNIQAYYRLHKSSMSAERFLAAISDRQERLDTCEFVTSHWCQEIPEAKKWLLDLRRTMAVECYWLANQPGYTVAEREACASFARRTDPVRVLSVPRFKYELKRLIAGPGSRPRPRRVLRGNYRPLYSDGGLKKAMTSEMARRKRR